MLHSLLFMYNSNYCFLLLAFRQLCNENTIRVVCVRVRGFGLGVEKVGRITVNAAFVGV